MDVPLIVHAGFWLHNSFVSHYSLTHMHDGPEVALEAKKYGPAYMTSWNMLFQWIFLSIALYIDIIKYLPKTKSRDITLKNLKLMNWYFFSAVVFPITLMVATIFWGLYTLDEDYVIEGLRHFMPKWLNHSIHTNILIVVFAEMLMIKHSLPKPSFKTAMAVVISIGIVYFIQFMTIYYFNEKFLYGVFKILSWPGRLGFTIFIHVLSVAYLKLGYMLQNTLSIPKKIQD